MSASTKATLKPIPFSALTGWADDDVAAAFAPFLRTCTRIQDAGAAPRPAVAPDSSLLSVCKIAAALGANPNPRTIRTFFEAHFAPHEIVAPTSKLTAYYEPVVEGARTPTDRFRHPLYTKPDDLVTAADAAETSIVLPHGLEAAQRQGEGLAPYATRAEIDAGALAGKGLELIYLADAADAYFVHIQGSTRVRLPDGTLERYGFAAKNGHPYRSVGRALLDSGTIPPEAATAEDVKAWMRANPKSARTFMQVNPSYVFFQRIEGLDTDLGPIGGAGVPLTSGRSLAVDHTLHAYGLPFWIESQLPVGEGGRMASFRRLMIAQDTGAAITGPARGDLFWGTGPEAGAIAGRVNNPGRFVVLLPCGAGE